MRALALYDSQGRPSNIPSNGLSGRPYFVLLGDFALLLHDVEESLREIAACKDVAFSRGIALRALAQISETNHSGKVQS